MANLSQCERRQNASSSQSELPGESLSSDLTLVQSSRKSKRWNNLVAYWLLGLCNNYGYVVMLSAAHDILSTDFNESINSTSPPANVSSNTTRDCNRISTGAILLADVLPSLGVKTIAPFLLFSVHLRVALVVLLATAGFLLVALASVEWMAVLGVLCTSLGSGLGEVTFLSYSTYFDRNVVSTWSSGTGGAGIFGAGSYAGLIALGMKPANALLVMLIVPLIMSASFWILLQHPEKNDVKALVKLEKYSMQPSTVAEASSNMEASKTMKPVMSLKEKLLFIPSLCKYMLPLTAVYLFEYFINQGLFELIEFYNTWLTHKEQYRWLQLIYQIGVFISRSSVNIVTISHIWVMAVLQFLNVILFTFQVLYEFIPNIWIVFAIVLWEGLLGGAAYVNTFYRISVEVPKEKREFSIGITTLSDAVGICLAGFISIPVHNILCNLPKPA
ncbi:battenin isoform X2 [Bacillus rossius redtenbacheri]|uniref:battenin isoform X2 n=1 Tax=Bacillus rossius redtenbacheri TaxID=93214 RepID=UPI002FDE6F22